MHVSAPAALNADNISSTLPKFLAMPKGYVCESEAQSVTSSSYQPETWLPMRDARAKFELGGEAGFDAWVMKALRINPEEAYKQYNTSKKV
jgi:adenosine deaminase CECR1